jgi:hypothetical protein
MHFRAVHLSVQALKRPLTVTLAAVFLTGGLFNTRIGGELATKAPAYMQAHSGECCLLESPLRWQQGTGVSQGLLPATVSLTTALAIQLFPAILPSAVLPQIRAEIPHLRGPPAF